MKINFLRSYQKFILQNFKAKKSIFFQNDSDKNFFNSNKIGINSSYLIPGSGIDLNQVSVQKIQNTETNQLFFHGRILKDKGIVELIDIWSC